MITEKRLIELERNVVKSMGWNANATEKERKQVNKRWDKMAGNTCFHDALKKMIKEKSEKAREKKILKQRIKLN